LFEIVKNGENSLCKPSLVIYFEPHPMPIKLKLGLHIGGKQLPEVLPKGLSKYTFLFVLNPHHQIVCMIAWPSPLGNIGWD
jgi:hypothetical protein